jgi:hypothetical protein
LLDGLSQNLGATLKLVDGHELAGPVRLSDVAGSDHRSFAA